MAISVLRYLTENPYTKGATLAAGDELATPQTSDNIVYVVETELEFSGGGRIARFQPVTIGNLEIPGVSLAATVANTNWCPVRVGFPVRVIALSVTGKDQAAGNEAVAIGDIIYYDAGELNKDETNGTCFGIALNTVSAGASTVIPVLLLPFGGLANV